MSNIILLGAPGSGKGTLAKHFSKKLNFQHISLGNILRTSTNQDVIKTISAGNLVSDELALKILCDRLTSDDCLSGTVIDGYPRTINQALLLDKTDVAIRCVIHLDAPQHIFIDRLLTRLTCSNCTAIYNMISKQPKIATVCDECNSPLSFRQDDINLEVIENRMMIYSQAVDSIIQFYKNKDKLITIDAAKDVLSDVLLETERK